MAQKEKNWNDYQRIGTTDIWHMKLWRNEKKTTKVNGFDNNKNRKNQL